METAEKKSAIPDIHKLAPERPSESGKLEAAPPEQSLSPSALDLTTVQNVKDFLDVTANQDDQIIQGLITSCGAYWLWRTGLGAQNNVNTQSPLNSQVSFNEWYDGNGSLRMYLRNRPIVSVSLLQIN